MTTRAANLPVFGRETPDFDLDSQEFRFTGLLSDGSRVDLGGLLESVEWKDEGSVWNVNTITSMTGTITYRKGDPLLGATTVLQAGNRIRCDVKWHGRWQHLWEMRIQTPPQVAVEDGTATAQLADDLQLASRSVSIKRYRKGTHVRRRGWKYDEIVVDICRAFRIPVNTLVKGQAWMTLTSDIHRVSPLEVIRQAVAKEQSYTGRRFVIYWRANAAGRYGVTVAHPARNNTLYVLGPQIITANIENTYQTADDGTGMFATAIVANGSTKKGKNGKRVKFLHREVAPASVLRQFGYIEHRFHVKGNVDGASEVINGAKAELAARLKQTKVIAGLTHPGIAYVRRGDTVRVSIPSEGFTGGVGIMFVTSVIHTLTAGSYTMALDLQTLDPLDPVKMKAERDIAIRAQKRAAKGKK